MFESEEKRTINAMVRNGKFDSNKGKSKWQWFKCLTFGGKFSTAHTFDNGTMPAFEMNITNPRKTTGKIR